MSWVEWQFDGLVGPTHNYAGLSYGNVAAISNAHSASNPKQAALQGLEKMRYVSDLGVKQAFFPPHTRPRLDVLRRLGFGGDTTVMLEEAYRTAPELLASVYSASNMWVANAATVTPSICSGKVTFTPANLINKFHRCIEAPFTTHMLRQIFADEGHFVVHDPLPATEKFGDEGAANHMAVFSVADKPAFHIFVYGKEDSTLPKTAKFPARQSCESFREIVRMHKLSEGTSVLVEQAPSVIDAGVFHNDVIAMSNGSLVIAHAAAYSDAHSLKNAMRNYDSGLQYIEVSEKDLSVSDAVQTYFFNSQLLTVGDRMEIVAPIECQENPSAYNYFVKLVEGDNPVSKVHYLDVRESMRNGGGPACLRLRVPLTQAESDAMHQGTVLSDATYAAVKAWIEKHYRDRLSLDDLRDPKLVEEVQVAMEALAEIVQLPHLYNGQ